MPERADAACFSARLKARFFNKLVTVAHQVDSVVT